MPRNLTAQVQAILSGPNAEAVYLMQFEFSGTTLRITTHVDDISWNGQTWTGIGGTITFTSVDETTDDKGQGVEMKLSGVDTSIVAILMAQNYVGRKVSVWKAYIDFGAIEPDPILLFVGVMNSGFEIEESMDAQPPTVTITGRIVSRLALLDQERGFRCNLQSHQHVFSDDSFFQNVALLPLTPIYWGTGFPPGSTIRT
jgi:hypothetical protein